MDRAQALGDQALAMCIDKIDKEDNFESYLINDSDLLVDLNMLLDDVHDYVSKKLKRKLTDVPKTTPSPNPDDIRTERSAISVCTKDQLKFQAAVALLGECSRNGFERLRTKFSEDLSIDISQFPSYYVLTKNRQVIIDEYRLLSINPDATTLENKVKPIELTT